LAKKPLFTRRIWEKTTEVKPILEKLEIGEKTNDLVDMNFFEQKNIRT
jgi:hypothetical protein